VLPVRYQNSTLNYTATSRHQLWLTLMMVMFGLKLRAVEKNPETLVDTSRQTGLEVKAEKPIYGGHVS
jgi:hypothetical protein